MKDYIKETQNEDGWMTLSTDLQNIKPKDTILFDTFLDKKGVYSVDIRLSNAIATPGRTMAVNISLLSPSKQTLFNNQKTLQPTLSKSKLDSNTWNLFIPIEDGTLNSCLSISYKSNALLNPIEISTIIKFINANDRKEIIEAIENQKIRHAKPEEFVPFQVINFDLCGCTEEMPPLQNTSDNENSKEEIELTSPNKETTENLLKEKETPKEREVGNDNTLVDTTTSMSTPEVTPSNFVLVEKDKSVDTDTIVYETIKENAASQNDKNFHKKTIFEDYNVSISSLTKYVKTMPVTPGVYALQLDISNKINSPRRSLEITYKIYNNTGEDFVPIKQNLVEKFSQKEILMLKKGYLFLKPDICVPNENCTLWLKIKSPVLIPVKLDVKLFQTKSLTVSEHILSNPLRQINDVKNFITELIPVKKNVWSIQKTLSFNKTEIFEIELSPGVYTFFISKLDNMDIPLRNFKLNLSLHNDRMCEETQNVSLKTICVDQQVGDGENSQPDSNIEFECHDDCVLRIRLDAGMMSAPIPFYARVQKLTKFDLKTIRHEGLSWLYYLSIFLGFFVFIKYILLFVNFFSSFNIFGLNFEFVFLFVFLYWFFSTDQLSNMKYYQVKIDEMRLKTGFEKFKMFLKHAKTGEEERKLEILNRKFSD